MPFGLDIGQLCLRHPRTQYSQQLVSLKIPGLDGHLRVHMSKM